MTTKTAEKPTAIGPFKQALNQQAYLKAGVLGFAGGGKTFTAMLIAMGLHEHLRKQKVKTGPVFMLDTETGSDFLVDRFKKEKIPFFVSKGRSFTTLLDGVKHAEAENAILLIDSISHFWRELMKSYQLAHNRKRLLFQDWGPIKETWGQFTDAFLNSRVHIIMSGRAGYEYDYFEDEAGQKQLEKTGTKMQAETNMGYEPSLLIEIVRRHKEQETKGRPKQVEGQLWDHVAYVLKDRSALLEGKTFVNPTFADFQPHVDFLNLGGEHVGVTTTDDSKTLFPKEGDNGYHRRRQIEVALEEIQGFLTSAYPGQSAAEKKIKADLLEECFGTRSWTKMQDFDPEMLRKGLANLKERAAANPAPAKEA